MLVKNLLACAMLVLGSVFSHTCAGALAATLDAPTDTCHEIAAAGTPASDGAIRNKAGKFALVIGNATYSGGISPLRNPAHDASAVTDVLRKLNFTVFLALDARGATIRDCVARMQASLLGDDIALIYYSGHGIQIDDRNYLVATDAKAGGALSDAFVYIDEIIDGMKEKSASILVFLDACRNNPFAGEGNQGLSVSTGRGLDRGLAKVNLGTTGARKEARGIFVAYSTSPNATATDGEGDLSPFTAAFVKAVKTPGFSVQRALSEVSRSVGEATDWSQTPWVKSSLTAEILLNGVLTLEEALSVSQNHATTSKRLLATGDVQGAIVEAFRGLPQRIDETTAVQYPPAYQALTAATRSSSIVLPVPKDNIHVVIVNASGSRAVVASVDREYRGTGKGTLEIWDTAAKKVIGTLGDVGTAVPSAKFSADGSRVAAYLGNGITKVSDAITGETIATITLSTDNLGPAHGAFNPPILVFSQDGAVLVNTLHKKGMALVQGWDVASGAKRFEFDLGSRCNELVKIAGWTLDRGFAVLNADGASLSFVCTNNSPKIGKAIVVGRWSLLQNTMIGSGVLPVADEIYPMGFGFSPDGTRMTVQELDNGGSYQIVVLDTQSGQQIGDVTKGLFSSFSPEGDLYSVVHEGGAMIFSARNGELVNEITDYAYTVPAAFRKFGEKFADYALLDNDMSTLTHDVWWRPPGTLTVAEAARSRLTTEQKAEVDAGALAYNEIP
ncbi:MAG: caspase family protein [Shinella sp.]|uniref:caspase family protein n=1 Tax=Shinella sp. TaxID=1870904 RepID=UPI0040368CAB